MDRFEHEAVRHSVSEHVRDQAHINGIESFWATLKRGYHGTYHSYEPEAPKTGTLASSRVGTTSVMPTPSTR